jgi:hypothetical protein
LNFYLAYKTGNISAAEVIGKLFDTVGVLESSFNFIEEIKQKLS